MQQLEFWERPRLSADQLSVVGREIRNLYWYTLLDARCSQADLIICVDAASSTIAQKVSGDRGLPLVSVVFDDELLAWDSTTLHWSDKLYVQSEHGMKLLIDAGVDPYTISLLAANPVGGMHAQDLLSILEQEPA